MILLHELYEPKWIVICFKKYTHSWEAQVALFKTMQQTRGSFHTLMGPAGALWLTDDFFKLCIKASECKGINEDIP